MTYEDFEREFNGILKIVAENPEKFDSDEYTTLDEFILINNDSYECWMHPGHRGICKNSSIFVLTLKKQNFSYVYPFFLDNTPYNPFPHVNPKKCKIIETPREIYDHYQNSEELITAMNMCIMEEI